MAWSIESVQQTFLDSMVANGHVLIEGHSVRSPTDDVLFTTAGMHPLTPYLHGEPHPEGRRLTDVQRCVRTTDIDEVGDNTHLTVFEMLGNWSLGDYFKETAIPMSFRLLTEDFGIDPDRLYVTVFAGDAEVPADEEAPAIWSDAFSGAGVDPSGRINPLGEEDNWWSNGPVGLCGPDTEMFVYVGSDTDPTFADSPEFVEIWNNVFMTYDRADDGTLGQLDQRNVDTGMGLERITMFLNGHSAVWANDELSAITDGVAAALAIAPSSLDANGVHSLRVVSDHLRASLAIAAAGIHPAASRQGYVLRRLVRRAVRHAELLRGTDERLSEVMAASAAAVSDVMGARWADIGSGETGDAARATIDQEAGKFAKTLRNGTDHLHELAEQSATFDGELAFHLADTLGYPAELSAEEAARIGMTVDPAWEARYDELREVQHAAPEAERAQHALAPARAMTTMASLQAAVQAISGDWQAERAERQQRRHLDQADFDRLRDAGLLAAIAPAEVGGLWESVEQSARPLTGLYRTLGAADPSVALVSTMHPSVINFWLASPDASQPDWEAQRRAVFESAVAGEQWGTITSEPGSGGDLARTRALAQPIDGAGSLPGRCYAVRGDKHFGSGSGITDRMITTTLPAGETDPTIFVLDVRGRPWDGSAGLQLVAEWDGMGMAATQSHAMRLADAPAVRMAWGGVLDPITRAAGPVVATLFTSVVLGILDEAVGLARTQLAVKADQLRAYEQVEWSRAELDHWLAEQAYEGALRAIESGDPVRAFHAGLRAKEAIAELGEGILRRLTRVLGGGTFSGRSPFAHWFEDVRALGFLRPPWGLAYDSLLATSFTPSTPTPTP